jgi:hypothetical protein
MMEVVDTMGYHANWREAASKDFHSSISPLYIFNFHADKTVHGDVQERWGVSQYGVCPILDRCCFLQWSQSRLPES